MSQIYFIGATPYVFRSVFPSPGVQNCTYCNRHMSDRYCQLLASGNEMELIPAITQSAVSAYICLLQYVQF